MRLLLSSSLLWVLVCGLALAADTTVWVASPWEHVLNNSPPGQQTTAHLACAGNEYESFRVVVRAGDDSLAGVTVQVSDLQGSTGVIPAARIALYREHYLHVTAPSARSTAPVGWYPDPLIPFADPLTGADLSGAQYDAVPCTVPAGENQGFWGDIYVPTNTPAGVYRSQVTVSAGGQTVGSVRLRLQVWPFNLPETFAMRSNFGSLGRALSYAKLKPGTPAADRFLDRTIDLFLAHRCQPSYLGNIWPQWDPDKGLDDSASGARLRRMVVDRHVNSLLLPFPWSQGPEKCRAYMRALAGYLRQKGWLDLAYVYLRDEPNNAEQYELVRQQGKLLHEADPGIKRLCTEQTVTSNPAWGDLYGAVDIWCPLWGLWDDPTAARRQALGEELWSYTALCQGPDGTPWWQIDFPPVSFRAPFWTSWHYGVKGFLYWSSVYWPADSDPWNSPHFRDRYWGEGVLIYPGAEAGLVGVVPSIRLKLIREAMEDYEYMAVAAAQGKKAQVDRIVGEVTTSFQDWEHHPYRYEQARRKLAALITAEER